ncbi:MAG: DcaP family trimeric outer membrane transporter [Myxococcota bacterium]
MFAPPKAHVWTCAVLAVAATGAAQTGDESDLDALRRQVDALGAEVAAQSVELERLRSAANNDSNLAEEEAGETTDDDRSHALRHLGRFPDDAIVTRGEFSGSIRIPDTEVSVRLGGLVLVEASLDIDSLGFAETLSPRTIPLDGTPDDGERQLGINARNSRINFDIRRDTALGPFRVFIEADFFGNGNELLSNFQFRLRHATAQLGNFYIGQWWSGFADVSALPETSNLGGPIAAPVARQASVRWGQNVGRHWRLVFSVENPEGDLTGPDDTLTADAFPDLTTYVQLDYSWLRFRIAGLLRRLETRTDDLFAGGFNATGRLPLPILGHDSNLTFQLQYGVGFARYYGGFAGAGLDGIVDANGAIEGIGVLGGYVAYQQWWSERWRSTVAVSVLNFDLPAIADDSIFSRGTYYAANVFWTPVDGVTVGVELIYATQKTQGGDEGSGFRAHASARFDF